MSKFLEDGWMVIDFEDSAPLFQAKREIEEQLTKILGVQTTLAQYHKYAADDTRHSEIQHQMCLFFREKRYTFDFFTQFKKPLLEILGFTFLCKQILI